MMRSLLLVPLVFVILAVNVSAVQEGVRICQTNTDCLIGDFVYNDSYELYTDRNCTINITFPNGSMAVTDAYMSNGTIATGFHNYTYTPPIDGLYVCEMFCNFSGDVGRRDCSFTVLNLTVYNISSDLSEMNETLYTFDIHVPSATYQPGESIQIVATLIQAGLTASGKVVNVTIYYPDWTQYLAANMTDMGNGIYIYNTSAPSDIGDYRVEVRYDSYLKSSKFTVSTLENTIDSESEETQDAIKREVRKRTEPILGWLERIDEFMRSNFVRMLIIGMVIAFVILVIAVLRKLYWSERRREEMPPVIERGVGE